MFFRAGNATRMRIDSSGNLFVGSGSAAVSKVDVSGNMTIGSGYAATNAAPANGLLVQGYVGIGTASPTATLDVSGSIRTRIKNGLGCADAS